MTTAYSPLACGHSVKSSMRLGEVTVVAPAMEQSGVAHSIHAVVALVVKASWRMSNGTTLGWKVEGSPADSVKLGICELMSRPAGPYRPRGINSRLQRRD